MKNPFSTDYLIEISLYHCQELSCDNVTMTQKLINEN